MSNHPTVAPNLTAEIDTAMDPRIEAEVEALGKMPIVELRQRYHALFRKEPPKAFGPDLLRRSISWRLQEKAYGGLPTATRRLLRAAMKAMAAKPDARIDLPRRPGPGAVLERAWNGRQYRVMVLAEGYAYEGKTFTSLSEIAGQITGTRWNGPRFFGLRQKPAEAGANSQGAASIASPASETSGLPSENSRRDKSRGEPVKQRRSGHPTDKPAEMDTGSSRSLRSPPRKRRAPARVS